MHSPIMMVVVAEFVLSERRRYGSNLGPETPELKFMSCSSFESAVSDDEENGKSKF